MIIKNESYSVSKLLKRNFRSQISGKSYVNSCLANPNGCGVKAMSPAVAGGVTTTTSKMQLCQEEELVWHHPIRASDGFGLFTPLKSDTSVFVNQARMVVAGGFIVMVWQERKQAVGICVTIVKVDVLPVGFEALGISISCD